MSGDTLRGRWVVLCDGDVYATPFVTDESSAAAYALNSSRNFPASPMAACRLGDARTLRRFEAGREVTHG